MAGTLIPVEKNGEKVDVLCADGEKLGTVGDIRYGSDAGGGIRVVEPEERRFFQVKRGMLYKDLWFEPEDVRGIREDQVVLTCDRAVAQERGFPKPPTDVERETVLIRENCTVRDPLDRVAGSRTGSFGACRWAWDRFLPSHSHLVPESS